MSFADDVRRFGDKFDRRAKRIHDMATDLAFESIVNGSPLTGSEGQRVDTGFLRASWTNTPLGPFENVISTPVAYAPLFEGLPYDPRGVQNPLASVRPSTVGLRNYSVLLTRASWQRIVDYATKQVGNA